MLQPNPEIQAVINNATELAINKEHEYVTLEHLLLAMITTDPFSKFLDSFGVDLDAMTDEIHLYLDQQTHLVSGNFDAYPRKRTAWNAHLIVHLLRCCLTVASLCVALICLSV